MRSATQLLSTRTALPSRHIMSVGHVVSKHFILLSYPDARSCLGHRDPHTSIHASPADPQDAVPYALFSGTSLESGLGIISWSAPQIRLICGRSIAVKLC